MEGNERKDDLFRPSRVRNCQYGMPFVHVSGHKRMPGGTEFEHVPTDSDSDSDSEFDTELGAGEVAASSGSLPTKFSSRVCDGRRQNREASEKIIDHDWATRAAVNIPARAAHSCDVIAENFAVIFGGWDGNSAMNDLWICDIQDSTMGANKWFSLELPGTPARRNNHATAVVGNRLFIMAGHDGSAGRGWLSDLHFIDFTPLVDRGNMSLEEALKRRANSLVWQQPQIQGRFPAPRACHSLSRVRRKLYMFGGYDGSQCFNSVEILDLRDMTWTTAPTRGLVPEGRNAHSMTVVDRQLYLCGGHAGKHHMTDLFLFDTKTNMWKEVQASGTWPPGLRGHSATLCGDEIILIGGYDGKVRNDALFIFNITEQRWTRIVERGEHFCSRQRHSAALIGSRKLFVFGGFNGATWMNDATILDLSKLYTSLTQQVGLKRLAVNLLQARKDGLYCDVSFQLGPAGPIERAHKVVLSAQSIYFANMLRSQMQEESAKIILLPDWPLDPFQLCVDFCYLGQLPPVADSAVLGEALKVAEFMLMHDLKREIENELCFRLNRKNVCTMLEWADRSDAARLKKTCKDYVYENGEDIVATNGFEKLSEHLLRDLLQHTLSSTHR